MKSRALAASVSFLLLLTPFLASAQTVDVQAQIASLHAWVLELQVRLDALKTAAQKPSTSSASSGAGECEIGARTLMFGMRGEDVRCLQKLLSKDASIYPERLVTGYFGALTQKAIERYQAKVGIVSAGSATTTGFGAVGPETFAALKGRRVSAVEVGVPAPAGLFVAICPADAYVCPDGSVVERTDLDCDFVCPGL